MSRGTRVPGRRQLTFRLQDYHLLWCAVPGSSTRLLVCNSMWSSPTTPQQPKPPWFGLFRVRSPLLTESLLCFLFLEVLRWFTSLGSPLPTYVFMSRSLDMTPVGLPHSEIPGSKRACRSPKLIAACYVLRRLSVPRHPPSTLSNLTIKCLDLMRSAVARYNNHALVHIFYLQPIFNCQRTLDREDRR